MENIRDIGEGVDEVEVRIGPQFLNLFSKQLYSSPNKAFEELVCNSWDADAENVYIGIPDNVMADGAKIWIADDGLSMDVEGFHDLWSVAASKKREEGSASKRSPIGKFGVGKLATYLLANQLTYICKSSDGIVRAITMDYRDIDEKEGQHLHIEPVPLSVRVLSKEEFSSVFSDLPNFEKLKDIFFNNIPKIECDKFEDEFGGLPPTPFDHTGTWTIVILSDLKNDGKPVQTGWIKRLLRTALPLGNSIRIELNGDALLPEKSGVEILKEWELGPDFELNFVEFENEELEIKKFSVPYPHIKIDGFGTLSGKVKLYNEKISGGKSENTKASNGFFVNVLGRVVQYGDPYFGLQDLHHGTWAKFRTTIRADMLDEKLTVDRDGIADCREVQVFRSLLRQVFNMARNHNKQALEEGWPNYGQAVSNELGNTIPFQPLERLVDENLVEDEEVIEFLDVSSIKDFAKARNDWRSDVIGNPQNIVKRTVARDMSPEEKMFRYDISTREVVMNKSHPFYKEHSGSEEAHQVLNDTVLVDLLTDTFILDSGLSEERLYEIRDYKDRMQRLVALMKRRSPISIAMALEDLTADEKGLEVIVGDALEHLGFVVDRMGQSGKPEGLATAIVSRQSDRSDEIYSFTYDAKSTKHKKTSTRNVGVSGLARHKEDCNAEFALVVAFNFEKGALEKECSTNGITPIRTADLAKLVMLTTGFGPLDLRELKGLFENYSPDDSATWVSKLSDNLDSKKLLSIPVIMKALNGLVSDNPKLPDIIHASQISERCRIILDDEDFPKRKQVTQVLRGLSKIAPNVISCNEDGNIYLLTHPNQIAAAITKQLSKVPERFQFGLTRNQKIEP